jgi:hypothetical protein
MNRVHLLPLLALTGAILLSAGSHAQPPGKAPPAVDPLPVVPKTAGAFVTLKVSTLLEHADLKSVLTQLAKQPDAMAGITEAIGVSPLEIDRVTLFWPRSIASGDDPILVITTREPYNEARVLKALRAQPVYDDDRGHGGGRWQAAPGASAPKVSVKVAEPEAIKSAPEPAGKGEGAPPFPKGPPPKQDDPAGECGPSGAGEPSDPLFYAPRGGPFEALFLVDDRTLVFLPGHGSEFAGMALLAAALKKNATGPLADAIAEAGKHAFAAGVYLSPVLQKLDRRVPAELVPYTALFKARTAVVTGDIDKSAKLTLTMKFEDAAGARRAAPVLEEGIASVAEKIASLADEMKDDRRPFEKAAAPLVSAFANALKKSTVKATDTVVVANTELEAGPVAAKALGDLVLAVQSRKKAAERMNNLKQIGLALHSYHDTTGKFPTNVYGPKGEPLLSWRVHLLPFLEQDNLYKQFKMDEAWDGPNNKKLIEQMPKVYLAPERDAPKGQTYYQGFIGPALEPLPRGVAGNAWLREGAKNGIRITEIHDGTSNTLAVIEAGRSVTWSKPDDLPFGGAVPSLGEKGWDRTPALRFDGSVTLFPTDLKPEQFWPYVTINGGEVTVDPDDRRGPFGGRGGGKPIAEPSTTNQAVPDPVKQREKEDARRREVEELTRVVEESAALIQSERERAELAAAQAARLQQLFAKGAATAAELAAAKSALEAAVERTRAGAAALKQRQQELEELRRATEGKKVPPKK